MRAKVLDYALIVKRINFWAILKVAIALAVLMYLFHLVEFDRMTAALRRANLILIIVALVLAPLNIFWLFMRWKYLVGYISGDRTVPDREVLGSIMTGTALRLTTPGGLCEYARILYILGVPRMKLLALALIDNAAAYFVTALVGCLGLAYVTGRLYLSLIPIFLIILTMIFVGIRKKINFPKVRFLPKRFRYDEFWEVIQNIPASRVIPVVIMSLAMYLGFTLQFFLLINAFQPISIVHGMSATSSIMLVKSSLPISFGDLGVREMASIYFLGKFGIDNAIALDASLLLFSFNLLVPAIIGSAFIIKFKLGTTGSAKQ